MSDRVLVPGTNQRRATPGFRLSVVLAVLLAGVALLAAGCASPSDPDKMIDSPPDFIGFVTEIGPGGEGEVLGRIVVASHADKLVRMIVLTIERDTLLFVRDGEEVRGVSFGTLQLQDDVQVWFAGPVQEGFPEYATARQLLIVPRD